MTAASGAAGMSVRLDRWLWRARLFRTRNLAGEACAGGRIRAGGEIVRKAHHAVRVGDVLTVPAGRDIRVVRVRSLGTRRGPPAEARTLYDEIGRPEDAAAGAGQGRRPPALAPSGKPRSAAADGGPRAPSTGTRWSGR